MGDIGDDQDRPSGPQQNNPWIKEIMPIAVGVPCSDDDEIRGPRLACQQLGGRLERGSPFDVPQITPWMRNFFPISSKAAVICRRSHGLGSENDHASS